ncbi:MAG: Rrf2 family transcriptional regulator [Geobacteraceae bacterium]|nr:Rrf2 family transcriptional regulator [Geobacteraceae bacterium]
MISMKTKYALKALGFLARAQGKDAFLIAEMAAAENIPKKFLEAILLTLKNQGILASKKGPGGGYSLAVAPEALPIGRVVRAFEGDLAPVPCLGDGAPVKCTECEDMATCGTRLVMADVKTAVTTVLDGVTLKDMLDRSEVERQKQSKTIDYTI